jgi:hypothetical protein
MGRSAALFGDHCRLAFEDVEPRRGYTVCTLSVSVEGKERLIELDQISPYISDMLGFFLELRRGDWSGLKSWTSEFSEVSIDATHDGGTVRFDVRIEWPASHGGDGWHGRLEFDQARLPRFAAELASALQLEHGSRFIRLSRQ